MSLTDLNAEELNIVAQCLRAAVYGPFFDEHSFQSLLGVSRSEAKVVADQFPNVDEFDDGAEGNDDAWLVINNALVNLLDYPHGHESSWAQFITVTPQQVRQVFEKWRSTSLPSVAGRR
ncbi:MAG: hypothetical protein V4563_05195 [Pseudomonadota bacterium]